MSTETKPADTPEQKKRWKVTPAAARTASECVVAADTAGEAEAKYRERFPLLAKTVPLKVTPVA